MLKQFYIRSSKKSELLDITSNVQNLLSSMNDVSGMVVVFVPHTTAGITINENADPDVKDDILKFANSLIPSNINFKHIEGNSDAHIKASLLGSSVNVIVEMGRLMLGTWQGIYFAEFDGPRERKVLVKIIS